MSRSQLLWAESFKKSDVKRWIKPYKSLTIQKSVKPKWFHGKWKQTYRVVPKTYKKK